MRTLIIAIVLACSYAVNETSNYNTMQPQEGQLGGCKLRCRRLTFIGEASVPVKPSWALIDLSIEVSSLQLQGGNMNTMSGSNVNTMSGSNVSGSGSGNQTGSSDAMKVRDEAHHRAQFILNYLKDLDTSSIKDLQTQEISLKPEFNFEDGDRKFVGYKATFGLSFKVKIDKFQEIVDHIVSESGANRVDSITFIPDEKDEKQANLKAIQLATQNAWDQAQAVVQVVGIQGTLKLLSVRDKLQPLKKLMRRFARRMDDDMGMGGRMFSNDDDLDGSDNMLNWLQADQMVNAALVFNFDFEDGTINFQNVQPIESNMSISETFAGLLKEGNKTQTTQPQTTQPQTTQPQTQPQTNQPQLTNTAQPVTNTAQPQTTVQPQSTPANTVP